MKDYNELFDRDFFVTRIPLAIFVKAGTENPIHSNRSFHGFAYHISGEKTYTFDDGTVIKAKENDLVYLPQHSNYKVSLDKAGNCYAINFLLNETFNAKPFKIGAKSETILQSFKKSERYFRLKQYNYKELCCKELYEIACFVKQNLYDKKHLSNKQYSILEKAKDYISNHYTTDSITLPQLSEYCGVSEVYLRKIFNSEYNISPINYVNQLRLSYAQSLIISREYSILDVCYMSGFNDVSYFYRAYKKHYGYSPKETIKNIIEND